MYENKYLINEIKYKIYISPNCFLYHYNQSENLSFNHQYILTLFEQKIFNIYVKKVFLLILNFIWLIYSSIIGNYKENE